MRPAAIAGLVAAALAAAPALARARAGDAAFVDPLDSPARPSALAPRGPLTAVTVAGGGRLVAVGERGHVLWSDDGGASWTQASVPVSADLTGVRFVSRERGWAVGHGVVLATADGGRSWVKQLDGRALATPSGASFLDVWFADERTGYAVGSFDLAVRTEDGGASWRPWLHRTENPGGLHLHAIARVAGDVWIVGEQGLVLRFDPAAGRFRAVAVPYRGSFFGVTGTASTVIAYGLRGHALRSRDRGATWQKVDTGVDGAITGATVTPDGRIVLVTEHGQLLVSDDEGAAFRLAEAGAGPRAAAVAAAGGASLVVVGASGARIETLP